MQIVKKNNKIAHKSHGNTQVDEYYMDNKTIDLCVVHINGRAPEKGRIVNTDFSCVCYLLDGTGKFCGQEITKGDAFNILSNEPYWFEGNFSMTMCGTPAWNPKQNKVID